MSILERIVSVYAPHACVGCGYEGSLLCERCLQDLTVTGACCYRCRSASRLGRTCASCRADSLLISVNCATSYAGVAKELVWSLKFNRAQAAADVMGSYMAQCFGSATPEDALIVPVPTAMKRVRRRGYDQAVLIARSYAKHTGRQYAPLLMRQGTQEQKGAGREQRLQQLHNAFILKSPRTVVGRRIILIDDVITTGATLDEAAATLKTGAAAAIAALAFARA